tara:strand:- start:58 stop:525 length:468 start_codon:yes stop_codon:yes gene_type:complete
MAASKTYSDFVKDLDASRGAVLCVASFLQLKGRDVTLPAHRVTPSESERYDFQDSGDLMVAQRHQVKHSSRCFESVDDFGFGMITVDEEYKIEKQTYAPPAGYWIINKTLTGGIWIPWSTKSNWDIHQSKDHAQGGRLCSYVRCPKALCKYFSFK